MVQLKFSEILVWLVKTGYEWKLINVDDILIYPSSRRRSGSSSCKSNIMDNKKN